MTPEHKKLAIAEHERLISLGLEPLTWDQVLARLNRIGYSARIDFRYFNRGNPKHYPAASIAIIDKTTGKSFANVDADRTNLKALQEIRKNVTCLVNGRIAEL